MTETARERNFHDLGAVDARVIKQRFESRIGRYQIAARRSSECLGAQFQNLARTVAEHDLIAINAVQFCQGIDQFVVMYIGISTRQAERVRHRFERFRRRPVGIFVRAQADNAGRCRCRLRTTPSDWRTCDRLGR